MKPAPDQTRHRDVTLWGAAALVSGCLAIASLNVSAIVPHTVLAGLHATHLQAGSFNQMRAEMAQFRLEASRINREFRTLQTQFNLLDDGSGESARRIAALERSIPLLVESLPMGTDIDYGLLTASFADQEAELQEVDGGTIAIRQTPLLTGDDPALPTDQPMPPTIEQIEQPRQVQPGTPNVPSNVPPGIAIGPVIPPDRAQDEWNTLLTQVGSLLLGTIPLMIDSGLENETRLVAGPLPDAASAQSLCLRVVRAGLDCDPVDYAGLPLP